MKKTSGRKQEKLLQKYLIDKLLPSIKNTFFFLLQPSDVLDVKFLSYCSDVKKNGKVRALEVQPLRLGGQKNVGRGLVNLTNFFV